MSGNQLFADSALKRLHRELNFSMRSAFAEGTTRNLEIQWKSYLLFCEAFNFEAFPTSTDILCLYAQFLSRTLKSPDSIRNYISGVKTLHVILDLDYTQIKNYQINLAVRGISRALHHCPRQAEPITPQILLEIHHELDLEDQKHATFWCLFLFAFFLMARKSNLVPDSHAKFDSQKQLLRSDVFEEENVLLVILKWSKTNQFGKRHIRIPLVSIQDSPLCPVKAYKNMCALVPMNHCEAAFQLPSKQKHNKTVTYVQFHTFFRYILGKIHRNPTIFSSHSFRRGGATWAFQSSVPGELIQLLGDWKSEAYKQYLNYSDNDKLIVSQRMSNSILSLQRVQSQ